MSRRLRLDNVCTREFNNAFKRPIYADLWMLWITLGFVLIDASAWRYSDREPGKILWLGIAAFVYLAVGVARWLLHPQLRKEILGLTPERTRGWNPPVLKLLAVLQLAVVIYLWTTPVP